MAVKTYGSIEFDSYDNKWIMRDAQPHILIKLKNIFQKLAKYSICPIPFENTPEICHDLEWFIQRYPLKISTEDLRRLTKQSKAYTTNINELERILTPDYIITPKSLKDGEQGRDYQVKGKDVYLMAKRMLNGDQLGLGKTLIAILSWLEKGTTPGLAVVQSHMQKQWLRYINRFTDLTVHCIKGTKIYSLPPADIYIIKYTCLAGWSSFIQTGFFKSVVFDECQELRREKSEKYKAAKVASAFAEYCLGLSATPIYNYGNEIWNIMNVIKENCLGSFPDFCREWIASGQRVKNPEALGTYLRESFLMLRRTRKEVGRELPKINTIVHYVEYDEEAVMESDKLAKELAMKVLTGSFIERGQAAQQLDMLVRQSTGVSKARGIAAYIRILLENNEPVVLAGWHREVYDIWLEELAEFKPAMYTGSESPSQKEKNKQRFLDGETNLFILSLRSGAGLDGLQHRCSTVVIGELDWSPKIHDQVIGRVDRDGQENPVTAIYLVSEDGSDPAMIELLGLKSSQSHGIIDPLEMPEEQYSDESRMKKLAEYYLNKKKSHQAIT